MTAALYLALLGSLALARGPKAQLYDCTLIQFPVKETSSREQVDNELFVLRQHGFPQEMMEQNRKLIERSNNQRKTRVQVQGVVTIYARDEYCYFQHFAPILGREKIDTFSMRYLYDGRNTYLDSEASPMLQIHLGNSRNYLNLYGDMLFLAGHVPSGVEYHPLSGDRRSIRGRYGGSGLQELEITYRNGRPFVAMGYLADGHGHRVIRASYRVLGGKVSEPGYHLVIRRFYGSNRPASEERYLLIKIRPFDERVERHIRLTQNRPIADFRLSDQSSVSYRWSGRLPSLAELTSKGKQDKGFDNGASHSSTSPVWLGLGLAMIGLYFYTRGSGKS